jgi:hypothetical protein
MQDELIFKKLVIKIKKLIKSLAKTRYALVICSESQSKKM